MPPITPVRAFFGHHRCASTWLDLILGAVARESRLRYGSVHATAVFAHDLRGWVTRRGLECLAFTNADYRYVPELAPYRAFHVIRDPRDVAVSCYFSHRYSHPTEGWPELLERRALLARLPKEEGMLFEMDQLAGQFACMRAWRYDDPDVLELTMEAVTADPYQQLLRVFRFLDLLDPSRFSLARRAGGLLAKGLRTAERVAGDRLTVPVGPRRLPAERLLGIVWEHDFEKMSGGRARGNEDVHGHFRKGVPGDWRNHFTPALVDAFKARYPGLVSDLGYERDEAWGLETSERRSEA